MEGIALELEKLLDAARGAILHAGDSGVAGEPPGQRRRYRDSAEARRIVDEQRDGRGVRQRREVAEQDIVGHLLAEITGREDQPEIRPHIGGLLEKPLGIALGVVSGAGQDHLPRALVPHDGRKHADLFFLREAAVLPVGPQGEIPEHAALRVAAEVEYEGVVVDRLVICKRRGDGNEDAGQFRQQFTRVANRGRKHGGSHLILLRFRGGWGRWCRPTNSAALQFLVVCGAPWSRRFAGHAGMPTGIPRRTSARTPTWQPKRSLHGSSAGAFLASHHTRLL